MITPNTCTKGFFPSYCCYRQFNFVYLSTNLRTHSHILSPLQQVARGNKKGYS